MRRFDELFDLLRRHPLAGRDASELGEGMRSLTHRSHRILYQASKDEVLVVRVLRHAMDAKRALRRTDEVEVWKAGADRYAKYYGDVRQLLSTEYAAGVRWITASLFALNAGGLASLVGKDDMNAMDKCVVLCFWLGILSAFWYVVYSQTKTKKFLGIIQNIENAWVVIAATGHRDEEKLESLEREKLEVKSELAVYLAVGSFAMFSLAIYLLANGS